MKISDRSVWFAAAIPADSHGGVAKTMHALSAQLRAKGMTTALVTMDDFPFRCNYLIFAVMLAVKLLLRTRKPDIIIARSGDGVLCAIISRILHFRTTVFIHNHGWEEKVRDLERHLPSEIITNPTTWRSELIRFPILRCALRWSHACLCGTIDETRYLKKKYPSLAHKLRYQPNGTVLPDISGRTAFPNRFLLVGGATWKKNIDHGLRIFSRIKHQQTDAMLCWIGAPADYLRVAVACEISPDAITAVTDEPFSAMTRWYREYSFLLFPSRFEGGHPLTVLEAMSQGMIVFVSAITSHREIVTDGINGIIIGGADAHVDAGQIMNAGSCPDVLKRISANAISSAARHTWERQGNRLYRTLAGVSGK